MKLDIDIPVSKFARQLMEDYQLTNYESLQIALLVERNEILKRAFVVSPYDDKPTALELIATNLEGK